MKARARLGAVSLCLHAASSLRSSTSSQVSRTTYRLPHRTSIRWRSNYERNRRLESTAEALLEPRENGETNRYSRLPRLYVGSSETANLICSLPWRDDARALPTLASCLKEQLQIQLTADQSHYVTNVLRLTKKRTIADPLVRLFDGASGEWLARITTEQQIDLIDSPRRRRTPSQPLTAECLECLRTQTPIDSSPCLWLAPPKKKERLRWLVEKATELNVQQFLFVDSDFSELGPLGIDKLGIYAVEAAEQSERLDVPKFGPPLDDGLLQLDILLEQWSVPDNRLDTKLMFCRERGDDSLAVLDALSQISKRFDEETIPRIAFVVGPEGGWSNREQSLMDDLVMRYPEDAFNVSLGNNVLRAETAAMAAVAAYAFFKDYRT